MFLYGSSSLWFLELARAVLKVKVKVKVKVKIRWAASDELKARR